MHKLLSVILAALMLLSLFAPALAEDKVITLWHIQTQPPQQEVIEKAKARFEAANPGYKIDISVYQNDPYKTKIQVALAAGEEPDIFPSWSGGTMIEYVLANQLFDMTPLMEKDNYKDLFMDAAIDQVTYDGKIWGVPVENVAVAMLFCSKSAFEDAGLEYPTTVAELEAVAEAFKAKGIAPFALANATKWTGSMYYMYLVNRIGGAEVFMNAANRFKPDGFLDPAFTQAGEIIQKWVKAGYFNEGFNGLDEDNGQSRMLLYTGNAAMYLMGSWFLATGASENPDFMQNVAIIPFPVYEGGAGDPTAVVGTVGDNFYHISANCEHSEMAFEFLKTMMDEEGIQERLAVGKLPPVKGLKVEDPNLQTILDVVSNASSVQLWYDQYMSPAMAELHKDTSQALFGLSMTPEEVNKAMQAGIDAQ
ncbi:MAG TPA: extracellular solute-binding protein [Clostridia bacterium]|jgi:raffinose/stachyose/melibiose transport system substrate-binding protein|nr:extracellular solute-binding protein [Clostridia bacterium]HQA98283.1 extracellular solute-binding protein [Clostridia bacterium]HQO56981.1 extracellular solute-binding protein [Clostridia bacterium]HUM60348.1 extracellular solute-binding protein [Clostridia bacterium]